MAITAADYDAQSAVERELVLRLASLLWRLRRATAIESGLFRIQARRLLQFRQIRQAHQKRLHIIDSIYREAVATEGDMQCNEDELTDNLEAGSELTAEPADQSDDLTRSFIRLSNLPTYPLDRLSRYEATLWRQACQILFALQLLERRKPWDRMRPRIR
jgi:two-component sensor histidine kinase